MVLEIILILLGLASSIIGLVISIKKFKLNRKDYIGLIVNSLLILVFLILFFVVVF